MYGSPESLPIIDVLFEKIAYYSILESIEEAKRIGKFKKYEGSAWDRGIIFGRDKQWYLYNSHLKDKWESVFEGLEKYGIANGQLFAIAPNTSSSLLQGSTASVLPPFSKFFVDKGNKHSVSVASPFIRDKFWHYKEFKHYDMKNIIDVVSIVQKWVDSGISMELLYDLSKPIKAKELWDNFIYAWKSDLKTIYYTRFIQQSGDVKDKDECISCSN